jgi:flagellar motility protein MotE (MotC chaperone)
LENVAKRGERNGHGKLPSKILAKKLGERRAGMV